METRANFLVIGLFTLATIAGGFLFVLWFSGVGRSGDQKVYQVIFNGSVSGLSRGSSVLFNGLKVGEVTSIDFLQDDPSRVAALVNILGRTPMKEDTKARLELQGLTGSSAIELTGGTAEAKPLEGKDGQPAIIYADPSQIQNLLENVQRLSSKADDAIGRLDKLIDDNGPAITATIGNVEKFSEVLANSSSGINSFLTGAADLGQKIGPLASRLQVLSDDLDKLVQAVDVAKVRSVVDDVASFTRTIRDNQGHIDSVLTDAASLAARLNDTSLKLDSALDSVNGLAKAIDAAKVSSAISDIASAAGEVNRVAAAIDPDKVRDVVSNVASLSDTIGRNQSYIETLLTNAADLAKHLNGTSFKLDDALTTVKDLAKSFDSAKIATAVDNVTGFTQTLQDNRGNVDRMLKDASELAAKLDNSADKLDGLMASLQGFVGSPETQGALTNIGDAAKSVQKLADDLNDRTRDIAAGISRFTGSGLREYEALAIDGRRVINDIDRAVRAFERNPNQLIFGAKPALPEYHGGP